MKPLVQIILNLIKKNPALADNPDYMMATLAANIQGFDNKTKCLNCGASMAQYVYEVSVLDALLLYGMAKEVVERTGRMQFTQANMIHVPSSDKITYTAKNRTGYTSKLGLIAKVMGPNKKQVPGTWAITARGWAAMRGEAIPQSVVVFRKQIIDRPGAMTTLKTVFNGYSENAQNEVNKNKVIKVDYRKDFADSEPTKWVKVIGYFQGNIF